MRRKILLVVSIVALGLGSLSLYVHILRLDKKYTDLVHAGTEQMRLIQNLTAGSNKGYILLMRMAGSKDSAFRATMNEERIAVISTNNRLLDSLLLLVPEEGHDELNRVKQARTVYRVRSDQWAQRLLTSGAKSDVIAELDHDLYPYFKEYQQGIQVLLVDRHSGITSESAGYTAMARKQGGWMLAFAFSPLIITGSLLALLALAFFLVFTLVLRRTE